MPIALSSRIALASAASLCAQALFGLLMLRLFSPADVGRFTVVGQIGFFWMTLALAQSPLSFLANLHIAPAQALRRALVSSLRRWLVLLPVAVAALWMSGLSLIQFLPWAAAMALLQMAWYMAQPWALRTASGRSAALVRAVPPIAAVMFGVVLGQLWPASGATGLLLAATCSYAIGAMWLLQPTAASDSPPPNLAHTHSPTPSPAQADDRSAGLRLAHTVADAVAGTALLLVWHRAYGTAEASYLGVLLRLLGLFPAVVHAAWPQVRLSRGQQRKTVSLWVGCAGALCTAGGGLVVFAALRWGWIAPSWQALTGYLLPLVLWQGCACVFAALGHFPFQRGMARKFSQAAIGFNALQLIVLGAPLALDALAPVTHIWWVASTSATGLLALAAWFIRKT